MLINQLKAPEWQKHMERLPCAAAAGIITRSNASLVGAAADGDMKSATEE